MIIYDDDTNISCDVRFNIVSYVNTLLVTVLFFYYLNMLPSYF